MNKAVIFDLDGTLLNTLEDLKDSVNFALKKCGMPERNLEEIRTFVGNGMELLIKRAVPANTAKEETEKCLQIFTEHYALNMENKTRPYEGVLWLLGELKKRGYKIAVVSNKNDAPVKALCEKYFENKIDCALGVSEKIEKKPSPAGTLRALKMLETEKENTLYIGDSEVDVATAQNAGVSFVGVDWGFRTREKLKEAGAKTIASTAEELLRKIDAAKVM